MFEPEHVNGLNRAVALIRDFTMKGADAHNVVECIQILDVITMEIRLTLKEQMETTARQGVAKQKKEEAAAKKKADEIQLQTAARKAGNGADKAEPTPVP